MKIDRPITIAVILFVVLLLVFFLIVPEYKKFKVLQTDLAEKTAEYNAEFDYYASITKTYQELLAHEEDLQKVDDAIPEDPNLGEIVYFLQNNALENGMIVKDLFLSKTSQSAGKSVKAGTKDIIFSIDLLGDYLSLQKFIISLEKSARLFEVTAITFGSDTLIPAETTQTQFQIQQTYSFNLEIKVRSY